MSNRRKPGWERKTQGKGRSSSGPLAQALNVNMPKDEKTVIKEVPAKVDGEVVGKAILFDDGTTEVVLNDVISDNAKAKMGDVVMAFNKESGATFSVEDITGKEF